MAGTWKITQYGYDKGAGTGTGTDTESQGGGRSLPRLSKKLTFDDSEDYSSQGTGYTATQAAPAPSPTRDNDKGWWDSKADEDVTNGIGANGQYTEKAGDFIQNNPFASPDYYKNWVNGGNPSEFANFHTAPTTAEWARYGDAFNNRRWWNPGTAGELGTIGGGGSTSGTIGEVGHGERWQPIDTQELRAQQRREDYEKQVRNLGIQRQDTYARYPYDMNRRQQELQMDTNYGINRRRAELEIEYGMLKQKCDDLVQGTGVYAQALWALCGVGGFHVNDMDRIAMSRLETVINRGKREGWSMEKIQQECNNIMRSMIEYKAQQYGTTVEVMWNLMRDYMSSGQFGNMWSNMGLAGNLLF